MLETREIMLTANTNSNAAPSQIDSGEDDALMRNE